MRFPTLFAAAAIATTVGLGCCPSRLPAAPTHELIAGFTKAPSAPAGDLLVADGFLWGVTSAGGPRGKGTIFRVRPDGSALETLHFFGEHSAEGLYPSGRLVRTATGAFIGTTANGGAQDQGTVFEWRPDGSYRVLITFTGGRMGFIPSNLVISPDGTIHGTTAYGGTSNRGTIFRLTPSGEFSVVADFSTQMGFVIGLRAATDGSLLGATAQTAFRLTGTSLQVLQTFTGPGVTGAPVEGPDGTLYGTAHGGQFLYGMLWKLPPGGALQTVVDFQPSSAGAGDLHFGPDGNLYGMTKGGQVALTDAAIPESTPLVINYLGTVYRCTPGGALTVLRDFGSCYDECAGVKGPRTPVGNLVRSPEGSLFGALKAGGQSDSGMIFQFSTDGVYRVVSQFNEVASAPAGVGPLGGLVQAPDGAFYGTTEAGGSDGAGTLFRLSEEGELTTLRNAAMGHPQAAPTVGPGGDLFGTTLDGGIGNGSIYRYRPGGEFSVIASFTAEGATKGLRPVAPLTLGGDGMLYGTTSGGTFAYPPRTTSSGTIFRTTPEGALTTLVTLGGLYSGYRPSAELYRAVDGQMYGTTRHGGNLLGGILFRLDGSGALTRLAEFDRPVDGQSGPVGGVIAGPAGSFLGTTFETGDFTNTGFLYRRNADGSLDRLLIFGTQGLAKPRASLTLGADGHYYGTTSAGGLAFGAVYRLSAAGDFQLLFPFTGTGSQPDTGAAPGTGALLAARDGNLYGTTQSGGPGGGGTIYRIRFGPTPRTLAATEVRAISVVLHGSINPNGAVTSAQFEFGTSPDQLDQLTAVQTLPAESTPQAVTAGLTGLLPETRYYYRLRGDNAEQNLPQRGTVLSFLRKSALAVQEFVATSGGSALLTISGIPGRSCQVMATESLAAPWQPVGTLQFGPSGEVQFSGLLGPARTRFFRVVSVD